jgi:HEAT repeat protein
MKFWTIAVSLVCLCAGALSAQESESKLKIKGLRDWSREGSPAIDKVAAYLVDVDPEVRREAVKSLVVIGTQRSLDPLIKATADEDGEVQIRATDGIVNFYFPGYVEQGMTAQLKKAGALLPSVFKDENDQVIDPDMSVRPEIVMALSRVVASGASPAAKANAARACGILRGKAASPALMAALKTKDDGIMYESIMALQKIGDPGNGPGMAFLARDLNPKIQLAVIETLGLLRTREAIPQLKRVLDGNPDRKTKRAAYLALGRIADPGAHDLLLRGLDDKDEEVRAGAAEGLGRLGRADDTGRLESYYQSEGKWSPRMAAAFALVSFGQTGMGETDPLRYLVNALNQKAWKGVAQAYLVELCRKENVRQAVYPALDASATKDEKTGLAVALAGSGGKDAVAALEKLSRDADAEVGREALRGLRILRSSL